MYFIVMALIIHGHPVAMNNLATAQRFPTHEACFADATARALIIQKAGSHGRFLCMKRGESDAQLDQEVTADF